MKNSSQSYLREVQNQILSKEAKEFVLAELSHHIKEVKNEWIKKGLKEADAEVKSVEQMGSPVTLGQRLNKLHRTKVDWLMVILLVITLGLSFLPILSLGNNFNNDSMNMRYDSTHKAIFVILGVIVAFGMMLIDFRKLEKRGWLFYVMGMLILLVLRFFPTHFINGLPLLQIGPLTIDSLMAIPFFFLAWASFFNDKKLKMWHLSILFFISSYFIFTIPSVSTVYIYGVMVIVMFCWGQFSSKTILSTLGVIISLFLILSIMLWQVSAPYQKSSLLAFLNPERYPDSEGYMILLLKELLSKAGWFGNSMTNDFIPAAHTNFVFANLTSYFGWLFGIALVVILSLFIARIVVITRKIHYSYGKLLLIGAVALYTVQLFTNIAMTLGFFPLIAMSLPFMSYGLMPTLFNAFLIGVVLCVYRRKDLVSSGFMTNEVRVK
ncbi:FtsW/RodA/SpoVE family cell cycle protein [Psychrobacillus glaciei]|uniref:FtsW/RodA/SpoVE family cell cycle protein n=1 Tax=Psychrobacillus glaciei TaxID=2283160 RepID=A0A5J6SN43_9BACI|nr:FtsW/RodA/SpoVE family cell cycle protein [Psychrobacillus glaciei]QFF99375.1 FtsW/RodA/SpoVE family cell cycle protein [Psychrobacillus glaciei]